MRDLFKETLPKGQKEKNAMQLEGFEPGPHEVLLTWNVLYYWVTAPAPLL